LVVLAILALMVGMTVPLLGNSIPRTAVGAAAAEIRAALRGASSQAIAEGRTVVFAATSARATGWTGGIIRLPRRGTR
jgi:Tfp pilus assembly protein FimT